MLLRGLHFLANVSSIAVAAVDGDYSTVVAQLRGATSDVMDLLRSSATATARRVRNDDVAVEIARQALAYLHNVTRLGDDVAGALVAVGAPTLAVVVVSHWRTPLAHEALAVLVALARQRHVAEVVAVVPDVLLPRLDAVSAADAGDHQPDGACCLRTLSFLAAVSEQGGIEDGLRLSVTALPWVADALRRHGAGSADVSHLAIAFLLHVATTAPPSRSVLLQSVDHVLAAMTAHETPGVRVSGLALLSKLSESRSSCARLAAEVPRVVALVDANDCGSVCAVTPFLARLTLASRSMDLPWLWLSGVTTLLQSAASPDAIGIDDDTRSLAQHALEWCRGATVRLGAVTLTAAMATVATMLRR